MNELLISVAIVAGAAGVVLGMIIGAVVMLVTAGWLAEREDDSLRRQDRPAGWGMSFPPDAHDHESPPPPPARRD
ncbi:MAG: hypothetical protein WD928_05150 [Gammaproteobacteria bacterium]